MLTLPQEMGILSLLFCLCMPTKRVPLAEAHHVELICLYRILIMARFASEAELQTFLARLGPDNSHFASTLWQHGVRRARQLANATKPLLLSARAVH